MDVFRRVWNSIGNDRITLVAGGVTFYLLLALFPGLAVFVSVYGLLADPVAVSNHVGMLDMVVPQEGLGLIRDRLESLATQNSGALGIGAALSLLIAFWSANNGIKALIQALNIAYGESEKRSFLRLNLIAFGFTLGAMATAAILFAAIGIVPALLALLRVEGAAETLFSLLRWPFLLIFMMAGLSLLYRFGPSRENAKWRWINWGSALATLGWVITSVGFSLYLQHFADYEATYGSLGAAIGFMMWTWVSVVILILGAKLNAEMEHQTAEDSTTGPAEPMGQRGAYVADTLGTSN